MRRDAPKVIDAIDGRDVMIGRRGVRALDTPGHTVGGTCFLADGFVVTGDVLFVGGCGRTDFPGGDTADDVAQPAAAGGACPRRRASTPATTTARRRRRRSAHEIRENPFLRCKTFEEFRALGMWSNDRTRRPGACRAVSRQIYYPDAAAAVVILRRMSSRLTPAAALFLLIVACSSARENLAWGGPMRPST